MIYFMTAFLLDINDASIVWWGGFTFILFLDICWRIGENSK